MMSGSCDHRYNNMCRQCNCIVGRLVCFPASSQCVWDQHFAAFVSNRVHLVVDQHSVCPCYKRHRLARNTCCAGPHPAFKISARPCAVHQASPACRCFQFTRLYLPKFRHTVRASTKSIRHFVPVVVLPVLHMLVLVHRAGDSCPTAPPICCRI